MLSKDSSQFNQKISAKDPSFNSSLDLNLMMKLRMDQDIKFSSPEKQASSFKDSEDLRLSPITSMRQTSDKQKQSEPMSEEHYLETQRENRNMTTIPDTQRKLIIDIENLDTKNFDTTDQVKLTTENKEYATLLDIVGEDEDHDILIKNQPN